jgi:hypothetical protein
MSIRPTKRAFETVVERDQGRCAKCGEEIWGVRGEDFSLHHRRPAGSGGDARPESHGPSNLLLLHGSGTTGCHGEVETDREKAREVGLLVSRFQDPRVEPVEHAVHGKVFLRDDGTVTRCA